MAFKLKKRGGGDRSRWIEIKDAGVRIRVRHLTVAHNEAASFAATRRLEEMASAVEEARKAGVEPGTGSAFDISNRDDWSGLFTQFHGEELMKRVVIEWEGIVDEDGVPVEPSPEAFAALAEEREVGTRFYIQILRPLKEEAEEKNAPSPGAAGASEPAPATVAAASPPPSPTTETSPVPAEPPQFFDLGGAAYPPDQTPVAVPTAQASSTVPAPPTG